MKSCRGIIISMAAGTILWVLIVVACRSVVAGQTTITTIYIQQITVPTTIYKSGAGVAWCSGCPGNAEKLKARYWYSCCDVCPPANSDRIAIIRPGWQWSSECDSDYDGYILMGNENEFSSLTPGQMADWLIDQRAIYQDAIFVCLNSYDLEYAVDVLAQLPDDLCQIIGVHIYDNVDVHEHLDGLCADCRVWITEIGRCYTGRDAAEILGSQISQAWADVRVEMIMGYTDTGDGCLDMIKPDGTLYDTGGAFVGAYPPP